MKHLSLSLYLMASEFGFSSWLPSEPGGLLQSGLQLVVLILALICSFFVVFKLLMISLSLSLVYYKPVNATSYITYNLPVL